MDARCPAAAHQEDIAVDPARRSHLAGLGHWIDAHRLHAMATRGAGYRPSGQHFDPTRLRATDEMVGNVPPYRSEEHTSELQSPMRISYAVFCLKKKKNRS